MCCQLHSQYKSSEGAAVSAVVAGGAVQVQVDETYTRNIENLVHGMCMLACTIGDEHQNHKLKASSLQRLSAMVWFMSEFSHIFDHFDKGQQEVWCTSINPADPGILIEADKSSTYRSNNETDIPAIGLFKMLLKYRPEDRAQKKERVLKSSSRGRRRNSRD